LPALLACWAGPAHAAGFYLTDRGARALGRGGAFTVGASDLNAVWFNPSLAGRTSDGVLAHVDLGLIHQSVSYQRLIDEKVADVYPGCCASVDNDNGVLPDPSVMVGYAPPGGRWTAVLSVHAPYGTMPAYPQDGPQRYSIVSLESLIIHYQATLAYALSDDLRVGVGFRVTDFRIRQRMMISAYTGFLGQAEDPDWDQLIELDVADHFNPGAVAGVWWRPHPSWELGASWESPIHPEAEGHLRIEVAGHYLFKTTFVDGSRVRLTTALPQVARVGVRHVGGDAWDAELNVVWEDWSVHDVIRVVPQEQIRFRSVPGLGDYRLRSFSVPEEFEDTFSVRLGGSWRPPVDLGVDLKLSGGAFWEMSAIPDETLSVNLVDGEKVGLGVGASLHLAKGIWFDVAYGHVFVASRVITNTKRRQVNVLYPEGAELRREGRTLVANGRYEAAFDTVAMSLSAEF